LAAAAARTLPARRQPWSSRWEIKTRTTSGKTRVATVSKAVRPKVIARKSEAMKPRRTSRANPIRVGMRREASDVSSRASRSAVGNKATGKTARPPAEHPAGRALDPATRIRRTDNGNGTPRRVRGAEPQASFLPGKAFAPEPRVRLKRPRLRHNRVARLTGCRMLYTLRSASRTSSASARACATGARR